MASDNIFDLDNDDGQNINLSLSNLQKNKNVKPYEQSAMLSSTLKNLQTVSHNLGALTKNTAMFTKNQLSEFKEKINEDFNVKKSNVVGTALAGSMPMVGYFTSKFFETQMMKSLGERFKESTSNTLKSLFKRKSKETNIDPFTGVDEKDIQKIIRKAPKLRTGGITKKDTVAVVHKNEAIMPLNKVTKNFDSMTKDLKDLVLELKEEKLGKYKINKGEKIKLFKSEAATAPEKLLETFTYYLGEGKSGKVSWHDQVITLLSQIKIGIAANDDDVMALAWNRVLLDNPNIRSMKYTYDMLSSAYKAPFKIYNFLTGNKNKYSRLLPQKGNVYEQMSSTMGVTFVQQMTKFDKLIDYSRMQVMVLQELLGAQGVKSKVNIQGSKPAIIGLEWLKDMIQESRSDTGRVRVFPLMKRLFGSLLFGGPNTSKYEEEIEGADSSEGGFLEAPPIWKIFKIFQSQFGKKGILKSMLPGSFSKEDPSTGEYNFTIPKFAKGGYISNIKDGVLSMVHGNEAILPLEKVPEIFAATYQNIKQKGKETLTSLPLDKLKTFYIEVEEKIHNRLGYLTKDDLKDVQGAMTSSGVLPDLSKLNPLQKRKWQEGELMEVKKMEYYKETVLGQDKILDTLIDQYDLLKKTGKVWQQIPSFFMLNALYIVKGLYSLWKEGKKDLEKNVFEKATGFSGLLGPLSSILFGGGKGGKMSKYLKWRYLKNIPFTKILKGGGVLAVIAAAIEGMQGTSKTSEWFGDRPRELSQYGASFAGGVLGGTESGGKGAMSGALGWGATGAGIGAMFGGPVGAAIGGGIGALAGGIMGFVGGEKMAKGSHFLWNSIKGLTKATWGLIKLPFSIINNAVIKPISDAMETGLPIAKGYWDSFIKKIGDFKNNIMESVTNFFGEIYDVFKKAFPDLAGWLENQVNNMRSSYNKWKDARDQKWKDAHMKEADFNKKYWAEKNAKAKAEAEATKKRREESGSAWWTFRGEVTGGIDKSVQDWLNSNSSSANTTSSNISTPKGFDKTQLEKMKMMEPTTLNNFLRMNEEYNKLTGKNIQVNSSFRTYGEQQAQKESEGKNAATPGRSMHEYGYAIDIQSKHANELNKLGLLDKYGFTRPYRHETWHLEPKSIQGNKEAIIIGGKKNYASALNTTPNINANTVANVQHGLDASKSDYMAQNLVNNTNNLVENMNKNSEKLLESSSNSMSNVVTAISNNSNQVNNNSNQANNKYSTIYDPDITAVLNGAY